MISEVVTRGSVKGSTVVGLNKLYTPVKGSNYHHHSSRPVGESEYSSDWKGWEGDPWLCKRVVASRL